MTPKGNAARAESTRLTHRRRIWDLDAGRHCSVLGTCLSLNDLHVIGRRARYRIDPGTSAYKLHSWFVDMVAYPNELSKLVDKELEKRHGKAADVVRGARTEAEIEARWKEVAARGQIAGAYWGAMSHPLCSEALQWTLFGEIHMLSHLVGASRRSDLARVHELEATCAALDSKLAQLKHDHRAVLKERKKLEDELTSRTRDLGRSERRLMSARDRIAASESQSYAGELATRVTDLERQLRDRDERLSMAEVALSNSHALLEDARREGERASEHVLELTAENEALEIELARGVGSSEQHDTPESGNEATLRGQRVFFVGGRCNLVQHYRALVERRGGEFMHHDGGLEESMDAITRALATVDVVVCPVDCVSHAAYLKVKRACKHLAKHFVVLRSSGLSSFARCLQQVGNPSAHPDSATSISVVGAKP